MAQMVGAKLLTEGNNILTFGNKTIMLNSLNILNIKQSFKNNKR